MLVREQVSLVVVAAAIGVTLLAARRQRAQRTPMPRRRRYRMPRTIAQQRVPEADAAQHAMYRCRELIRSLMRCITDTPAYRDCRWLNNKRGAALLAKMRTGSQTQADFTDEHALWGYLNAVGAKRAFNVAEAFCRLVQQETCAPRGLVDALLRRKRRLRVASVGGGPGSCLLGYCVFERIVANGAEHVTVHHITEQLPRSPPSAADERLFVFDYSPCWEPLARRVAIALAEPARFGGCDVACALSHACNAELHAASVAGLNLVMFVYCLHEADHDRVGLERSGRDPLWAQTVLGLWDAATASSVMLVKDQRWVEERVLALILRRRPGSLAASFVLPRAEGVRREGNESDGLFLLHA